MKNAITLATEKEILSECLQKLRDLHAITRAKVFSPKDPQIDAIFELEGIWGHAQYRVEVKRVLAPRDVGILKNLWKRLEGPKHLLLTRYVSSQLGEQLRAEGIEYVDTAGNAFLNTPPLVVDITGKRIPSPLARPRRVYHTKAIQLVHAILRNPGLVNSTQREMAKIANVALGSVGPTLDDLREQGFIGRGVGGGRVLIKPERLLERWEAAYLDVLRPALLQARARPVHEGFDHLRQAARARSRKWMLGGELAGSLLTRHLVPQEATVFIWIDTKTAMKALGLLEDPNGPVHLLKAWSDQLEPDTTPDGDPITDPILTHAELLREPDERLLETASIVLEKYIGPRFKT